MNEPTQLPAPKTKSELILSAKIVALAVLAGSGIVGGSITIASQRNDELAVILFAFIVFLLFKMYRIWTGQTLVGQIKKSVGEAIREERNSSRKRQD